ncbi:MAG: hypothetical protein A2V93_04235, partial [Ignavibacteria bacterium RBG_16_34_14]
GLDRYDGYNLKVFKFSPNDINSLGANSIRALYEDKLGTLWVGTLGGGLNKYIPGQEMFTRYFSNSKDFRSISSNTVTSIYEDKFGTLWVGTQDGGLNEFDLEKQQFIRYKNNPDDPTSISENNIYAIFEDSKGNLWIGTTGGGLNKFDRSNKKFIRYVHNPNDPNSLSDNKVTGICEDSFGNLWISTLGGGLNKLRVGEINYQPSFVRFMQDQNNSTSLPDNDIYYSLMDRDNVLWLGTWGEGLIRMFQGDKIDSVPIFFSYKHDPDDPFSLNDNNVTCIYEDNSGLLWVATWGGGLHIFNKQMKPFRQYKHKRNDPFSLSALGITTIYEDKSGIIWIGTWDGGLNKLDRSTYKFTHYKNNSSDQYSLSDNTILSICEDRAGVLWLGTQFGGLNKFDRKTEKFYKYNHDPQNPNSLNDNIIFSIYEDQSGIIWVGTSRGLNKFDKENESFSHRENNPGNLFNKVGDVSVYAIYRDEQEILWIGTRNGLYSFDSRNDKLIHHNFDPSKINYSSSLNIVSLYEDKSGILWIGTVERGLIKLNKESGRFVNYTTKDGLPSNYILGILEDNNGYLWLSTNYGLSKFDPFKESFRNYDVEDGLQSNEFEQFSSCCKSKTGELIFGGTNGFNIFYPDSIKDNPHTPPVYLTDFYLFNKPVAIGYDTLSRRTILSKSIIECEKIELNYDDKVFSLEFAALDFQAPGRNKYAYLMEGFDNDWIYTDADNRLVTYTNLDPREYIFRVRGSNNDGVWNEQGTSIKIIILPPWYQTMLAYLIYFVLLVSIAYGTWKTQLKRIRTKHEFEMSKFEAQKLHEVDEMKSRFFTNISHEFRTPLTLILGPAKDILEKSKESETKQNVGLIKRNAGRLLKLVNQLLDLSKLEAGRMKLETKEENIIPLLRGLVLSFSSLAERKKVTLRFNTTEEIINVYLDGDKIEKIINNLLSNACKFTTEGGRVEVTVKRLNKELEIRIFDSGIGIKKDNLDKIFDRFYQVDESHTREQEGTGIGLALTKELVELHKGKIEVQSELGKGTTFTVKILLGKDHLKPEEIVDKRREQEYKSYIEKFELEAESKVSKEKTDVDILIDTEKPLLLIVEDNSDVRKYIISHLENNYRIQEAVDGQDGLEQAFNHIPDLIISDVMMPKLDGFELCFKLKTDERTSHIPIIMLTAKATSQDKISGYETGADDYIMKPFDATELKVRIKNLIEIRKKLQEKFKSEDFQIPKELSPIDEEFMKRVLKVIYEHLSEEEFSIEELGRESYMSRAQIYKKIKALTGKSPSLFLRSVRLTKARKMLKDKQGTISEIAFSVGFNSPAYFTKCFSEEFGYLPSDISRS